MKFRALISAAAAVLAVALPAGACLAQAKNLIFYGNSFTIATGFGSSRNVPELVRDIAVAAGQPQPYIVNPSIAGWSLQQHRASNTGPITTAIAAGQRWDAVVLQDFSTQPTTLGNLALHRSSYVSMYEAVRAHSPNVKAIGFETWARAPGHSYYAGANPSFPGGPAQMQQQVRDGYNLSTGDVNALYGPGTSTVSPVGDAWENAGFPVNFYAGDLYHAQNRGTLITALTLYTTIYGDNTTSDIPLGPILSSLSLSTADGVFLTSVVDATVPEPTAGAFVVVLAVAALRRRP